MDKTMGDCVIRICMYLWGVAVLLLDSLPDNNKGPEHAPCACQRPNPQILDSSHTTQPFDCTTFVWNSNCAEIGKTRDLVKTMSTTTLFHQDLTKMTGMTGGTPKMAPKLPY